MSSELVQKVSIHCDTLSMVSHQLVQSMMFDLVRPLVLSLISCILLRHEETNSSHRVFQQGTPVNKSVAIVGAGSAGLAMLKALVDLPEGGGWEIVLYEQRRDVGGIWYDEFFHRCQQPLDAPQASGPTTRPPTISAGDTAVPPSPHQHPCPYHDLPWLSIPARNAPLSESRIYRTIPPRLCITREPHAIHHA
jgi:hypothetical protein